MVSKFNNFLLSPFYGGLDKILSVFEEDKFRFCYLEDIAQVRYANDKDRKEYAGFCYEGMILMKEGILCFPENKTARLVRNSPLLEPQVRYVPEKGISIFPPNITSNIEGNCMISGKEFLDLIRNNFEKSNFYPNKERIMRAKEESVDFPVLEEGEIISIGADNFDKDEITIFAFGGKREAKAYGTELMKFGINNIIIRPIDRKIIEIFEKPFVLQVFYGFDKTQSTMHLESTFLFSKMKYNIYGIKKV